MYIYYAILSDSVSLLYPEENIMKITECINAEPP